MDNVNDKQVRSDEQLGVLYRCPLCGGDKGYKLAEGGSYRWWYVICVACGEIVTECRSDPDHKVTEPLPTRSESASACWNEAGAYANRMRETLQGIADADWRRWEELATPDEFVRWAKARALHALTPNTRA